MLINASWSTSTTPLTLSHEIFQVMPFHIVWQISNIDSTILLWIFAYTSHHLILVFWTSTPLWWTSVTRPCTWWTWSAFTSSVTVATTRSASRWIGSIAMTRAARATPWWAGTIALHCVSHASLLLKFEWRNVENKTWNDGRWIMRQSEDENRTMSKLNGIDVFWGAALLSRIRSYQAVPVRVGGRSGARLKCASTSSNQQPALWTIPRRTMPIIVREINVMMRCDFFNGTDWIVWFGTYLSILTGKVVLRYRSSKWLIKRNMPTLSRSDMIQTGS